MPRPPLELETWGKIRRTTVDGKPTAVAYYRDSDGVTRPMQRQGKTGAEAERNLIRALKQRLAPTNDDLTADSTVSRLAEKWLETKTTLAAGSLRSYSEAITRHISPGIGSVRLAEATVPKLDRFLTALAKSSGTGMATTVHVVLKGMFTLAARQGAVKSNPMSDVPKPTAQKRAAVTAPDLAVVRGIRARFALWDAGAEPRPEGDRRRRLARTSDLADTADTVIGTGIRTGELLALKWDAVDLERQVLTVTRTIAQDSAGKFFIQEHGKSEGSYRELELPDHVVQILMRRRIDSYSELVFPSSVGTFRIPNNYRTAWRQALADTEYAGVTPKSFRKTVATVLRDELGITAAQDQLGHASEKTTQEHYTARARRGPAAGLVLATLFAENPE